MADMKSGAKTLHERHIPATNINAQTPLDCSNCHFSGTAHTMLTVGTDGGAIHAQIHHLQGQPCSQVDGTPVSDTLNISSLAAHIIMSFLRPGRAQ